MILRQMQINLIEYINFNQEIDMRFMHVARSENKHIKGNYTYAKLKGIMQKIKLFCSSFFKSLVTLLQEGVSSVEVYCASEVLAERTWQIRNSNLGTTYTEDIYLFKRNTLGKEKGTKTTGSEWFIPLKDRQVGRQQLYLGKG